MVKIVEEIPSRVTCQCKTVLEYLPSEIKNGVHYDFDYSSENYRYIVCPACKSHVTIK